MSAMLEQLPKFISHYARANDIHDNSVYLAPDASHTGLFDLLKEELATKSIEPPSMTWFVSVLHKQYPHLKVHRPHEDKCNT